MILHQLETQTDPVTGKLSDDALMTFYNVWIKSSANFYKTDVISLLQQAHVPVLSHRPDSCTYPFVLGVDPAGVGKDKTAMAVVGLPGSDLRYLHAVYQWEKLKPEAIAGYIHQLVDRYGIKLIVMDKSGALGHIVAEACSNPMQLINGIYEERPPIFPWDHPDADTSRAAIVLTLPSDEKMKSGVYGDQYSRGITGEIDLKNALHISMKAQMESARFLAPANIEVTAYYQPDLVASTKGEILDNIRESLAQFPRVDRKKDSDGNIITDGRGNWTFTRPPKDDGAYSIVYANWAANIAYKQTVIEPNRGVSVLWSASVEQDQKPAQNHAVYRPTFY
jgi:hypothetical protein